jgi:hypothetical protein
VLLAGCASRGTGYTIGSMHPANPNAPQAPEAASPMLMRDLSQLTSHPASPGTEDTHAGHEHRDSENRKEHDHEKEGQ